MSISEDFGNLRLLDIPGVREKSADGIKRWNRRMEEEEVEGKKRTRRKRRSRRMEEGKDEDEDERERWRREGWGGDVDEGKEG